MKFAIWGGSKIGDYHQCHIIQLNTSQSIIFHYWKGKDKTYQLRENGLLPSDLMDIISNKKRKSVR